MNLSKPYPHCCRYHATGGARELDHGDDPAPGNFETLQRHARTARELSDVLFSSESLPCMRSESRCFDVEEKRPLTRAERARGWTRRPFSAYDPEKLCAHCAAYYFAERTAQTLEGRVAVAAVETRRIGRTA